MAAPLRDVAWVLRKLEWLRNERIWPNGQRYLWTDAFGVVLLVSLYREVGDACYLRDAEQLVADVNRVLGRARGIRIGEAPDRDGQYFHYLAMWMFALAVLGQVRPQYRAVGIKLAKEVHPAFVLPGRGVIWKMTEDLSKPYPHSGLGALDAYDGLVSYTALDPTGSTLGQEMDQMRALIHRTFRSADVDQDLGIGMLLWLAHWLPWEPWAPVLTQRCLAKLDDMWVEPPGYFCRWPWARGERYAFTNAGVAIGLQAVAAESKAAGSASASASASSGGTGGASTAASTSTHRLSRLLAYFDGYKSGDHYDRDAITHIMLAAAHFPGALLRGFAGAADSRVAQAAASALVVPLALAQAPAASGASARGEDGAAAKRRLAADGAASSDLAAAAGANAAAGQVNVEQAGNGGGWPPLIPRPAQAAATG